MSWVTNCSSIIAHLKMRNVWGLHDKWSEYVDDYSRVIGLGELQVHCTELYCTVHCTVLCCTVLYVIHPDLVRFDSRGRDLEFDH